MRIKRPASVDRASMRYGIQLAAEVASDYDRYSSHPYLVSECILGKLNVLKGKPKKNTNALDRITAMERRVASTEATTRFIVGLTVAKIKRMIKEKQAALLKKANKALLNPRSKGWKAGTGRLLAELKKRKK